MYFEKRNILNWRFIFLLIFKVGDRPDSNVYIRNKLKTAKEVGINAQHYKFEKTVSEVDLIQRIEDLNRDAKTHGIIVQLPFDSALRINSDTIVNTVSPAKDVDGLHFVNAGKIAHNQMNDAFTPCKFYWNDLKLP